MKITKNDFSEINNYETPGISLSGYTKTLIEKLESGNILTDQGNIYSPETIRSYKYFLETWLQFQEYRGIDFNFNQIFPKLVAEFTVFLQSAGKSKNSIGLILSKMKAVLKFAYLEGYSFWNGSGIKTPRELTTKIYLSFSELKTLNETPLAEGQRRVLDVFLIQCFTGMRYDTLRKFLSSPTSYIKELDGKNYIEIVSDKTGEESAIPIGKTVKEILKRNTGKKLIFSEEYVNKTLKTIGAKAGLNSDVATRITKGGVLKETMNEKFKMISTHTARRTLISLAKQSNIPDREIMGISGHTTEKQLNTYNRSSNLEKIKSLLGNSFFDKDL